ACIACVARCPLLLSTHLYSNNAHPHSVEPVVLAFEGAKINFCTWAHCITLLAIVEWAYNDSVDIRCCSNMDSGCSAKGTWF
ncbi:MAG: hypothetical protein ACRC4U_04240, partial [Shewanella sp.]